MKTFDSPITLRVIRRSSLPLCTEEGEEVLPRPRLKLSSLVCDNGVRSTKTRDPAGEKVVCHILSCNVGHRRGLRPLGTSVHARKQVLLAPGRWKGPDDVDVYRVEALGRCWDGLQWSLGMAVHLAGLAG